MKTADEIINLLQANMDKLNEEFGVIELGVFGSYISNEQNEESDVDILVSLKEPVGFVKFLKLESYLSDLLGIKVDLVMKNSLKPFIGRIILKQVQYV